MIASAFAPRAVEHGETGRLQLGQSRPRQNGGGLMPIGAVLSSEAAFSERFALKHSSTFAGNSLACRAGIAALEMLVRHDCVLITQVRRNGRKLRQRLEALQAQLAHIQD